MWQADRLKPAVKWADDIAKWTLVTNRVANTYTVGRLNTTSGHSVWASQTW